MSGAGWFLAAAIAFATVGTAAILGIARWQFNRDKARWAQTGDDLGQVLGKAFRDMDAELDKILKDGDHRG